MKDNDTKLIWETHHKNFQHRGNVPQADHNPDATMYGKPVKDMAPTVAGLDKKYGKPDKKKVEEAGPPSMELGDRFTSDEESYEEKGQRGEGKSLLKALDPWLDTAKGDALKQVYDLILKAYQTAGYPDGSSSEEEIPRGGHDEVDDVEYREPSMQDQVGHPGDRG
jgi:hypothetical protein